MREIHGGDQYRICSAGGFRRNVGRVIGAYDSDGYPYLKPDKVKATLIGHVRFRPRDDAGVWLPTRIYFVRNVLPESGDRQE